MASPSKYGYERVKGTGKNELFRNIETGEVLSRRQFDKVRRVFELGRETTNEQLAQFNKTVEPERSFVRPARGKKSALKLPAEERARIAAQRKADEEARKKKSAELREQKKLHDKIERERHKKVKTPKKITGALLTPGALGRTIPFGSDDIDESHQEYLDLFDQGKKTRKIFGYTVGVSGVDIRTGRELNATLWRLRGFDRPIDSEIFEATVLEFLEEKSSYFLLTRFFMHLAFSAEYAKEKLKKYGDKTGNKRGYSKINKEKKRGKKK